MAHEPLLSQKRVKEASLSAKKKEEVSASSFFVSGREVLSLEAEDYYR